MSRQPSRSAGTVPLAAPLPFLLLCLAGCGNFFQSNAKPEQTYILRPPTAASAPAATAGSSAPPGGDNTATAAARAPSLRVGRPMAAPGLETAHIMLVQSNHRMNFYTGSRWAASVPDLIESLTVETLRGSGDWSAVQDSTSPFPSEYLLTINVQRFEADYTGGGAAPVVYVVLHSTLGRREGRDVIATFTASGEAPATENRLGAVVTAFETATGSALTSLAQQTARAAHAAAQNGAKPVPSMSRSSQ
ncbi:MAG TPA: ABC-type transport auxiliary lipoprotein family protein [Steroidobacteraceae bacterium]|nr:ABC-type transport auxiliary lipoprotein family protein [Steroidobacteraceae bacterium]